MNTEKSPGTAPTDDTQATQDQFLESLGDRIRRLRARRGLTRKGLSAESGVSERHLANLEGGEGNASVLVLRQLARALNCSLAELLGDATASSPEWLLLRELLQDRSEAELHRARIALTTLFGTGPTGAQARLRHIALIGLRGAGKSTLGRMLADELGVPFVEVGREIERVAGGSLAGIHALYGSGAYHRYERRALQQVLAEHDDAVIATPGSIVSESANFSLLLSHCYTGWLKASPREHMERVVAQGDLRPMGGETGIEEAMQDLKRILKGRAALYGKADFSVDTSGLTPEQAFAELLRQVRQARRPLFEVPASLLDQQKSAASA